MKNQTTFNITKLFSMPCKKCKEDLNGNMWTTCDDGGKTICKKCGFENTMVITGLQKWREAAKEFHIGVDLSMFGRDNKEIK